MNYEHMSDLEINGLVALRLSGCKGAAGEHMPNGVKALEIISGIEFYTERDYCNNHADAWPVIVENRISIIFDPDYNAYHVGAQFNNLAGCEGGGYDFRGRSIRVKKNPLRAAMIVFLMTQEAANA